MCLALLIPLFGNLAHGAPGGSNREIALTFANFYLQESNFRGARKHLQAHLKSDPKDSVAWNLLGFAHMEGNNLSSAAKAFLRAAKSTQSQARGIYLYNYADVLTRGGETGKAKKVLASLSSYEQVASHAQEALSVMEARKALPELDISEGGGRWGANMTVGSGYDSNVLLVSDLSRPVLSATDMASPYAALSGNLGYGTVLFGSQFDMNLKAAGVYQVSTAARKFSSLYSGLDLTFGHSTRGAKGVGWRAGTVTSVTWLGDAGIKMFQWTHGINTKLQVVHGPKSHSQLALLFTYEKFRSPSDGQADNVRTGPTIRPTVTHTQNFGRSLLAVTLGYEHHFSEGDNFKSDTIFFPISWTRKLGSKTAFLALIEPGLVSFTNSTFGRNDKYIHLTLGMNRKISSGLRGVLAYGFKRNISNLESAMYNKHMISLAVTLNLI